MLVQSDLTASKKGPNDGTLKILPFYFHFPIESGCGFNFINRSYTVMSHFYVWKWMDPAMNFRIILVQAAESVFNKNRD